MYWFSVVTCPAETIHVLMYYQKRLLTIEGIENVYDVICVGCVNYEFTHFGLVRYKLLPLSTSSNVCRPIDKNALIKVSRVHDANLIMLCSIWIDKNIHSTPLVMVWIVSLPFLLLEPRIAHRSESLHCTDTFTHPLPQQRIIYFSAGLHPREFP